jgi:hypothetical protein
MLANSTTIKPQNYLVWIAWKRKKGQRMESAQAKILEYCNQTSGVYCVNQEDAAIFVVTTDELCNFQALLQTESVKYGIVGIEEDNQAATNQAAAQARAMLGGILDALDSRSVGDNPGNDVLACLGFDQVREVYTRCDDIVQTWGDILKTAAQIKSACGTVLNRQLSARSAKSSALAGLIDLD